MPRWPEWRGLAAALALLLALGSAAVLTRVKPVHILALGDSYTIGEGVTEEQRWPAQMAMRMATAQVQPTVQYIARTGWTTDELSAAIKEAEQARVLRSNYDLVSLQIGVNNQYRGRAADEYAGEFDGLLLRAIAFAGDKPAHVLALSIPDWGMTPFAHSAGVDKARVARQIDRFNAVAARACKRHHVRFVDITDLTRSKERASWLVEDGLHPSAAMYAAWAQRVAATLPAQRTQRSP